MTTIERTKYLLEKVNGAPISLEEWKGLSDYSKIDLKRKCYVVIDEILLIFEGLHKPEYCAFDAIGERKYNYEGEYATHMTGYDMISYWKVVRLNIERL